MNDELTPEERFAAEDAETLVPRALLLGRTPEEIVADLVQLDYSAPAARALVERVRNEMREFNASPQSRQRLIDAAFRQFAGGLIVAVLGGVVSAALLAIAVVGGWLCIVGALLILGGGITIAGRGWARWRLYRGWAKSLEARQRRAGSDASGE